MFNIILVIIDKIGDHSVNLFFFGTCMVVDKVC